MLSELDDVIGIISYPGVFAVVSLCQSPDGIGVVVVVVPFVFNEIIYLTLVIDFYIRKFE